MSVVRSSKLGSSRVSSNFGALTPLETQPAEGKFSPMLHERVRWRLSFLILSEVDSMMAVPQSLMRLCVTAAANIIVLDIEKRFSSIISEDPSAATAYDALRSVLGRFVFPRLCSPVVDLT
jgi:hypothetical protein